VFPINFALFLIAKKKKKKIFYETALIINYTGIIICHTRAIWAALFFSFLFSVFLIFKFKGIKILKENKKWLILLFSLFLIITIIYSVDNPLNRSSISATERAASAFDMQGSSLKTRFLIWQSTLNMIKKKPLFGLGSGSFPLNYLYYQADFLSQKPEYLKYNTKAAEAHNEYLQTWSEMGIIGLLFFLLFIYLFYHHSIKIIRELEKNEEKIILIGLISGITITLFHSIFSFPLHIPATSAAFWFIVGLTVVLEDMFLKKDRNSKIIKYRRIFFYSDNNKIIFNIFKISIMIIIIFLIITLINTLIIKPYVAEIYYFSGMRDSVDKNYEKALSNFEYSAQLDNYNGRNLHALGTTYYNLKIYDKAEQVLQRAKNYITDVNTFYNLGLLYSQVGLYRKAENEFKYAVYLDPKHSKTYHNLGLLYFLVEDYDSAIEQWNKILEIDPDFPNKYVVLNNLGIVYKKKEMPGTALEYFLKALQLAPEGSPLIEEIEEGIYDIYRSNLEN
jgi:tetratricopeptide (TPR) repeat protein